MILLIYGTRPEWIKIKPLVDAFVGEIPHAPFRVMQHTDLVEDMGHDGFAVAESSGNRLCDVFLSVFQKAPEVIRRYKATHVLVQGDTATAAAFALAAFNMRVPVLHLEAGLRTNDIDSPWPEEGYRQMISRIAEFNFCPTELSAENLDAENLHDGVKIAVVGNTVLDNLVDLDPVYGDEVIVTFHRRENFPLIGEWLTEVARVAKASKLKFVFPVHPNPAVRAAIDRNVRRHIQIVAPMPYDEMKARLANCRYVITDSGGLQEEASFLNKRVIVCRNKTERPESLIAHSILCPSPDQLYRIALLSEKDYAIDEPCPYGDGKAAERIRDILLQEYGEQWIPEEEEEEEDAGEVEADVGDSPVE